MDPTETRPRAARTSGMRSTRSRPRRSSALRLALLLPLLGLASAGRPAPAAAAEPPPAAAPAGQAAPPQLVVPEAARARPGFDVERATEAYLATISPAAKERSDAYFEGGYVLFFVETLWIVAVSWLVLAGGRAARLRAAVRARIRNRLAGDFVIAVLLIVALTVLQLPYSLYDNFYREHAYGMSNETLGAHLLDWAKGLGVGTLMGAIAVTLLYAVIRRAPASWWLWGTGLTTVLSILAIAIAPVFIAPLFNDYQKLEPGALRDEILAMARAHRIPADDVWWFDASRQTKRISANVSGFGGTMRISLNDNLLRRSPRESVLAVLGHEMGHYVLNHVAELTVSFSLLFAAGFVFVHFTFGAVARRFPSFGLEGIADSAGLPLLNALLVVFFTLSAPVQNSIVRTNEAEADAFGLAAAAEPDGFAFAAVQLSEYRKMRPGRLEEIVFYDHPSGYDRIHRAMSWKAGHLAPMAAKEAAAEGAAAEPPAAPAAQGAP
jgi:STE24 endopeptidase